VFTLIRVVEMIFRRQECSLKIWKRNEAFN